MFLKDPASDKLNEHPKILPPHCPKSSRSPKTVYSVHVKSFESLDTTEIRRPRVPLGKRRSELPTFVSSGGLLTLPCPSTRLGSSPVLAKPKKHPNVNRTSDGQKRGSNRNPKLLHHLDSISASWIPTPPQHRSKIALVAGWPQGSPSLPSAILEPPGTSCGSFLGSPGA